VATVRLARRESLLVAASEISFDGSRPLAPSPGMSFPHPRFSASWALVSSLVLALGGAACGGSVAASPADDVDQGDAPRDPASAGPSSPVEPARPPVPKQPVGPYTGPVGTTDVSILYPLPRLGDSADFVRPTEIGNHGALLPESAFAAVLGGRPLDQTGGVPASGYGALGLVSMRLDPCSARGGAGGCRSEVRLVFQALYEKAAGDEAGAVAGTAAADGALHVMYDVPEAELETMMKEVLTLKRANGDLALQELAPHPILAAQGLGGAFAQGLRSIVLYHLGDARIGRITFFDHNFDLDSDGWQFGIFDRAGGAFAPGKIAHSNEPTQLVAGSSTSTPLAESSVSAFSLAESPDSVGKLVDGGRPPPGPAAVIALQPTFEAALRVQNPTLHTAETTDCANCHLAESARLLGESVYGMQSSSAFTHNRSLAYVSQLPTVSNLHAFGYLHRKVSIMHRTANESVIVADWMEKRLAPR
jgi:hypothetical protein